MISDDWLAVMSRISASKPIDLESVLGAPVQEGAGSRDAMPDRTLVGVRTLPSAKLWPKKDSSVPCVGFRFDCEVAHPAQLAYRLAAAALERGIAPIILATHSNSGLERFGFRVELLSGNTAEELCASEAEIMRFWDISVVINSSDIGGLF